MVCEDREFVIDGDKVKEPRWCDVMNGFYKSRVWDDYWKRAEDERKDRERKKYEASICYGCIHHDACYDWCVEHDWMYEQKECDNRRVAITPEQFAKKMEEIKDAYIDKDEDWNDVEDVHFDMDVLMMEVLESLGYVEGVAIFENTEKWYYA